MIHLSLPAAAENPTSTQASSDPSDLPGPVSDNRNDFSTFISQALDYFPGNIGGYDQIFSSPPPPPDNQTEPPSDDSNSSYAQGYGADPYASSSPANPPDNHSQRTYDRKQRNSATDPTDENNMSALLAGNFVPTPKPEQTAPAVTTARPGDDKGPDVAAGVSTGDAPTPASAAHAAAQESAAQTAGSVGKTLAAQAPHLAAALKPADATTQAAKDSAQTPSAGTTTASTAPEAAKATSQAAILQTIATIGAKDAPAAAGAGITAALDSQTMKSTGQKTENAGRTVQKLPGASSTGSSGAGSSGLAGGQLATTGSARKSDWSNLPGSFDLTIPMAAGELHDGPALTGGSAADSAASQVEHVAHLVAQEAMTMRQSGATSFAVSLKIDQQTELFVQLTNHNGQIQASLRCERGNLAGLDSHWGQLQESLARQNVQLLPPENGSFSRDTAGRQSDLASSKDFNQPSQNPRPENNAARSETSSAPDTTVSSKKTSKSSGRGGWESWA
jgi:hypothetical protein